MVRNCSKNNEKNMTHSIISWDCSYRNFFHLVYALVNQNYPKDDFELIYVEQRSEELASKYNHRLGLKSLRDVYNEVKDKINIKIIYLNDPLETPYHNGRCINAGLQEARGEIISVMDGDQLLEPSFLAKLTEYHRDHPRAVVNLFRKTAKYPVGVNFWRNWIKGRVDFSKCLFATLTKYTPVPKKVGNKAPMISASRKWWERIKGCDPHFVWSTALSKFGGDITARLEIATGTESVALPTTFSVHPWHPIGKGVLYFRKEGSLLSRIQDALIEWSRKYKEPDYEKRISFANALYLKHKAIVDNFIHKEIKRVEENLPKNILILYKLKIKLSQYSRKIWYEIKNIYEKNQINKKIF